MTFPTPSGAQIESVIAALREHAMSDADFDDEQTRGLNRQQTEAEVWWDIKINEAAPLVVQASTKRLYGTSADAYQAAEALRDVLVEACGWEPWVNSYLTVKAVEDSRQPDQLESWYGSVRLRLAPPAE